MNRVMTTCPTEGAPTPTFFRMNEAQFGKLDGERVFRCSTCAQVHHWAPADAWLEDRPARM